MLRITKSRRRRAGRVKGEGRIVCSCIIPFAWRVIIIEEMDSSQVPWLAIHSRGFQLAFLLSREASCLNDILHK